MLEATERSATTPGTEQSFESRCGHLRVQIRNIGDSVKALMGNSAFEGKEVYSGQHGEMKANIMLTYRHLEDARMRVGKVLQAADDGTSILDK